MKTAIQSLLYSGTDLNSKDNNCGKRKIDEATSAVSAKIFKVDNENSNLEVGENQKLKGYFCVK